MFGPLLHFLLAFRGVCLVVADELEDFAVVLPQSDFHYVRSITALELGAALTAKHLIRGEFSLVHA